jgi:hypothetical protein
MTLYPRLRFGTLSDKGFKFELIAMAYVFETVAFAVTILVIWCRLLNNLRAKTENDPI